MSDCVVIIITPWTVETVRREKAKRETRDNAPNEIYTAFLTSFFFFLLLILCATVLFISNNIHIYKKKKCFIIINNHKLTILKI